MTNLARTVLGGLLSFSAGLTLSCRPAYDKELPLCDPDSYPAGQKGAPWNLDVTGGEEADRIELFSQVGSTFPAVARIQLNAQQSFLASPWRLIVAASTPWLPYFAFLKQAGVGVEDLGDDMYLLSFPPNWREGGAILQRLGVPKNTAQMDHPAPALFFAQALRNPSQIAWEKLPPFKVVPEDLPTPFLDEIVSLRQVNSMEVELEALSVASEWPLHAIGMADLGPQMETGKEAVAVVDSGIWKHGQFGSTIVWSKAIEFLKPGQVPLRGTRSDRPCNVGCDGPIGHGTKVSGAVAAKDYGVAPETPLVPVKVFDDQGCGYLSNLVKAMREACGPARIVLLAWEFLLPPGSACGTSMTSRDHPLCRALRKQKTCLFIAAAGNGGGRLSLSQHYPAAFGGKLDNLMVVGGVTRMGKWRYNYDAQAIHLAAPAERCYTTFLSKGEDDYTTGGATSMAAAYVAGAAALYAKDRSVTPVQIKEALVRSANLKGEFQACCRAGCGVLDVRKLLTGVAASWKPESPDPSVCQGVTPGGPS